MTGHSPARRHRWWPVVLIALAVGAYGGLAGLQWWLVDLALERGRLAQQVFPGDEVEALIGVATAEDHPLSERNDAIHALAQLADPRALPGLDRLRTGKPCDHDRSVCQYELQKAIERCRGERQPPAWLAHMPLFPHPADARARP